MFNCDVHLTSNTMFICLLMYQCTTEAKKKFYAKFTILKCYLPLDWSFWKKKYNIAIICEVIKKYIKGIFQKPFLENLQSKLAHITFEWVKNLNDDKTTLTWKKTNTHTQCIINDREFIHLFFFYFFCKRDTKIIE